MVFFLIGDVAQHYGALRLAHAEAGVAFLSRKSSLGVVHPTRAVPLDFLHGFCQRGHWVQIDKQVDVVGCAARSNHDDVLCLADARDVTPQSVRFADEVHPLFGAEDAMK
jgi:hypothetical protein